MTHLDNYTFMQNPRAPFTLRIFYFYVSCWGEKIKTLSTSLSVIVCILKILFKKGLLCNNENKISF